MPVSNHSSKGLLGEWLPGVWAVLAVVLMGVVARPIYDVAGSIYESLNNAGWITHDHDTPVWIQGDWMAGEYRTCQLLTTTPMAGGVLSQEARAELPRLLCGRDPSESIFGSIVEFQNAVPNVTVAQWDRGDWSAFDSYFHVLPVRYNGRIERPDKWYVSWRCQRENASLTCKALN